MFCLRISSLNFFFSKFFYSIFSFLFELHLRVFIILEFKFSFYDTFFLYLLLFYLHHGFILNSYMFWLFIQQILSLFVRLIHLSSVQLLFYFSFRKRSVYFKIWKAYLFTKSFAISFQISWTMKLSVSI